MYIFKRINFKNSNFVNVIFITLISHLTLSWRTPLSYRNQSIHLPTKSMDWFLYDNGLRHERVKSTIISFRQVFLYADILDIFEIFIMQIFFFFSFSWSIIYWGIIYPQKRYLLTFAIYFSVLEMCWGPTDVHHVVKNLRQNNYWNGSSNHKKSVGAMKGGQDYKT